MKLASMTLQGDNLEIDVVDTSAEDIAQGTWTQEDITSKIKVLLRNKENRKDVLLSIARNFSLRADYVVINGDIRTRAPMKAKYMGYEPYVHIRVNSRKTCSIYHDVLWVREEDPMSLIDEDQISYGFCMRKTFDWDYEGELKEALIRELKSYTGYFKPYCCVITFTHRAKTYYSGRVVAETEGVHPLI